MNTTRASAGLGVLVLRVGFPLFTEAAMELLLIGILLGILISR